MRTFLLAASLALFVIGFWAMPSAAQGDPVYKQCVWVGKCSAVYAMIVCPGTPEFPAGLCTRCSDIEMDNYTCSGLPVENPCFGGPNPEGCGTMEAGTCANGVFGNWGNSNSRCGHQKWCVH